MAKYKYTWRPSLKDTRNYPSDIKEKLFLPKSVDLRTEGVGLPPVYDQGQLGSCTANAVAAAASYYCTQHWKALTSQPSRLYIYYGERNAEHTTGTDAGAMGHTGFKFVSKWGFATEDEWPYTEDFSERPPEGVWDAAKARAIKVYRHPAQTKRAIKSVLAAGNPVAFGFTVYASFESERVAQTGIVPLPAKDEAVLGGHEVLIVGYNSTYAICRNSWGTEWGDKGYFYMPWSYLLSELCDDFRYFSAS